MSKTLLFAPLFLDEGDRYQRNIKWLDYMFSIKQHINFDEILFVDNASALLPKFKEEIKKYNFPINIIECKVRFTRMTIHCYGFWYRAFARGTKYAIDHNYDKLLHLDSDVYLLNTKITDWCNKQNTGWVVPYCHVYDYPETTFQIICKDQLQNAEQWFREDFLEFYPYDLAETRIPVTIVDKTWKGDRYGEQGLQQTSDMDWYGQLAVKTEIKFNK